LHIFSEMAGWGNQGFSENPQLEFALCEWVSGEFAVYKQSGTVPASLAPGATDVLFLSCPDRAGQVPEVQPGE
jgi:hypothetical protein